jgi:GAF domain
MASALGRDTGPRMPPEKPVSQQPTKPVLDAQTFQKVLEAAFVLQEHNRKMREVEESLESKSERLREEERVEQARQPKPQAEPSARPDVDYTLTLAEIVEAQHQIRTQRLELDAAMNVVVDRLTRITKASGAAIGILDGTEVRYRAGAGSSALPVGTGVPLSNAVSQPSLRTGQVIRTKDVDTEFLFDPEPMRRRGIRSMVSVPIHFDGEIVGGLELYFHQIAGYAEQDIHTCQLMAGLVTEALGREAGLKLKKSMAEERSSMLAAIGRLQPNLAALAKNSSEEAGASNAPGLAAPADHLCSKCATALAAEEQFCGNCGSARAGNLRQPPTIQGEVASGWHADAEKKANGKSFKTAAAIGAGTGGVHGESSISAPELGDVLPDDVLAMFPITESELGKIDSATAVPLPAQNLGAESVPTELEAENGVAGSGEGPDTSDQRYLIWSSAARAQDFLESLSVTRRPGAFLRFWRFRRGDFYLALAIALVIGVIGWGLWSNHLPAGTANPGARTTKRVGHPAADSDLSMFDKLLISLGLAEAPDAVPEYKGNPDVQVWLDLNTAQYYCPGSDLYAKTPNGKLATQRQAQLDHFEPAYRKACD